VSKKGRSYGEKDEISFKSIKDEVMVKKEIKFQSPKIQPVGIIQN